MRAHSLTAAINKGVLADATIDYIIKAQVHFDDLKQVASSMAGMLVLAETGIAEAATEQPMIAIAYETWKRAADGVGTLKVPVLAEHFHVHLQKGSTLIGDLFASLYRRVPTSRSNDDAIRTLKLAWEQISFAAKALPGFETVDLEQSCCAMHAKQYMSNYAN
jgi:hypothetical protein